MKTLKTFIIATTMLISFNAEAQIFTIDRSGKTEFESLRIDLTDTIFKPNPNTIKYDLLISKGNNPERIRFWTFDGSSCSKVMKFKKPKEISSRTMYSKRTKSGLIYHEYHGYIKDIGDCTLIIEGLGDYLIIYGDTRKKHDVLYYDYGK